MMVESNLLDKLKNLKPGETIQLTAEEAAPWIKLLEETPPIKIHKSRCCGRCDGVNDECVKDTPCDRHKIYGCEICFGKKGTFMIYKIRTYADLLATLQKLPVNTLQQQVITKTMNRIESIYIVEKDEENDSVSEGDIFLNTDE
jgi:hypothetical protein